MPKDLQAHRGRSLVIAGEYQPASVHHLAHQLNQSLGNVGTTVTYAPTIEVQPVDQVASLRDLVTAMDAGQVDLLVILGSNPVSPRPRTSSSGAPGEFPPSGSHTLYRRDVDAPATGTSPRRTPSRAGAMAAVLTAPSRVMQPLIAPLYEGRTTQEVLAAFIDAQNGKSGSRSREGLLDARAGGQSRQLRDHRRDRTAVQESGQLLEARAA